MERVERVIIGSPVETCQLLIVNIGNLVKTLVSGTEVCRTCISIPWSRYRHVKTKAFLGIVRHHATVTRKDR